MTALSLDTVQRLRTQGFTTCDRDMLAEVAPWLRFSPALCAGFAAWGTVAGSPVILLALAGTALVGAVLRFHPFDLIYNFGIRFLLRKPPLPPNGTPRRFACGVAAVWLVATAILVAAGDILIAQVLGAVFVAVAVLVSTTDICIPSIIFGFFGRLASRDRAVHR